MKNVKSYMDIPVGENRIQVSLVGSHPLDAAFFEDLDMAWSLYRRQLERRAKAEGPAGAPSLTGKTDQFQQASTEKNQP